MYRGGAALSTVRGLLAAGVVVALLGCVPVHAQPDEPIQLALAAAPWESGPRTVQLGPALLRVPPGYRYLGRAALLRLLEQHGQADSWRWQGAGGAEAHAGLLAATDGDAWLAVVSAAEVGHIAPAAPPDATALAQALAARPAAASLFAAPARIAWLRAPRWDAPDRLSWSYTQELGGAVTAQLQALTLGRTWAVKYDVALTSAAGADVAQASLDALASAVDFEPAQRRAVAGAADPRARLTLEQVIVGTPAAPAPLRLNGRDPALDRALFGLIPLCFGYIFFPLRRSPAARHAPPPSS